MNLEVFLKLLTFTQFFLFCQSSHVQEAKQRIRSEVRSVLGHTTHHHRHHHSHPHSSPPRAYKHHYHQKHWSGRRHSSVDRHRFTGWSAWSACGHNCIRRRERFCKAKRKCGHTKHVEERKCWHCHPSPVWPPILPAVSQQQQQQQQQQTVQQSSHTPQAIIINAAAASGHQQPQPLPTQPPTLHVHQIRVPILHEIIHHEHHSYPKLVDKEEHIIENLSPDDDTSHSVDEVEVEDNGEYEEDQGDFFIVNERRKFKKEPKPILIDEDDYADLQTEEEDVTVGYDDSADENSDSNSDEGPFHDLEDLDKLDELELGLEANSKGSQNRVKALHPRKHRRGKQKIIHQRKRKQKVKQRNLLPGDDGIEGDTFQYEDFDIDPDVVRGFDNFYIDSYEDDEYAEIGNNSHYQQPSREKATPNALIPKHRRLYSKWSRWTKCSPKCTTRRYKKCRVREQCGREVLREIAYCYTEGSFCQQWLQAQVQKSPPYAVAASRRRDITDFSSNNAIANNDYIINSKGYRGPEYTPMKLKCGIAPIRNSHHNKRNMYNMLKIIGGKASRKGEWPWQVAIFNRFKEAFCGGTLIAPQWVLTAAHCVRKVLYVRIGEHNLDYEDGTELQLRVLKSFKHPSFDKKTVDSDVALLKLPKPVNASTWIGFSCLPRPYQPLPKNIECTVIGWGKRRNRDAAGTSVLHQASVPIISMDNCRSVYRDYTITKNMFCAGHKRGRIDTCAGDSGGPLLCRDNTKPNHPWTIFGITSFGDGCAKRNKFGIYAKVPNYVDWVWSVINCNGNCKLHQRSFGS